MAESSFSIDVAAIRDRARQKMADGPVTAGYGRSPEEVIGVLNDVLATEIVCWMRYAQHAISATGIDRAQVAAEFGEHADEERDHAMRAAERISQLGGDPDFDPRTIAARSHTTYVTFDDGDLRGCSRRTSSRSGSSSSPTRRSSAGWATATSPPAG